MNNLLRSAAAVTATLSAGALALTTAPLATAQDAGSPAGQGRYATQAQSYVALGDSYASGTGTRDYLDDGTTCLRSPAAYSSLIAAAQGHQLTLRACSGATVANVHEQLTAVNSETDLVSLSAGGNDAGFADVLTECAKPAWMSDCNGAIDAAVALIDNELPGRLSGLYSAVRTQAPAARVVVVGYPRIFNGEDCNAATFFSPEEEARLNDAAELLNAKASSEAAGAGFEFADPVPGFVGHAVCDNPEWINGLSNPIQESYHPNKAGHADGLTPLVSPLLTGAALDPGRKVRRAAAEQRSELTARVRRFADEDRHVKPKTVRVPDLTSPQARAAARAAGVDLSDPASIAAADRRAARKQARQWRSANASH